MAAGGDSVSDYTARLRVELAALKRERDLFANAYRGVLLDLLTLTGDALDGDGTVSLEDAANLTGLTAQHADTLGALFGDDLERTRALLAEHYGDDYRPQYHSDYYRRRVKTLANGSRTTLFRG